MLQYKCAVCGRLLEDEKNDTCSCGSQIFIKVTNEKDRTKEKIPTKERLENITMVNKGIFEINLESIVKNLVIIKDYEGVYYIRLPYGIEE